MCRRRVSRLLAMFILCWLLIFLPACAPSTDVVIGQFDEVTFEEKQLDSSYRIGKPQLHKTREMWLSSHEKDSKELVFGWSDIRFKLRAPNIESCELELYSSENDQCLECTACSRCGRLSLTDESARLIEPAFATLKADETTLHTFHMRHGCLDSPNHPRVEVRDGVTYSLTNKALATDKNGFSNALTLKTRIVNSPATFDLPITKKLAGSTTDDVKLYGNVEFVSEILNSEFSDSLKVTQIEVVPGKKNAAGVFKPTMDPKISVQPSRIVWVADFENLGYEDQVRCYFDRNNLNGTFNIFDGCRVDRDRGTLSALPNLLTPTHLELTAAATSAAPLLTWFVEYNRLDFIAQLPVVEKPTICTTTDREGNCEGIVPILRFTIEQK